MIKNYYFDMDGVLAQYEREAYIGDKPLWLQPNKHYFLNVKPDMRALSVIDLLWSYIRTGRQGLSPDSQIYIVSSISNKNGAIFNEQFHDKLKWIAEKIPYFPVENFYISVSSKRDICEMVNNRHISFNDILIDDYNRNLSEWTASGGRAIKYCNGINTPDTWFPELRLDIDLTPEQIIDKIT